MHPDAWHVKGAAGMEDASVAVSVRGPGGQLLEAVQETPPPAAQADQQLRCVGRRPGMHVHTTLLRTERLCAWHACKLWARRQLQCCSTPSLLCTHLHAFMRRRWAATVHLQTPLSELGDDWTIFFELVSW